MEPISVGVCATATGSAIKLIQNTFAYTEVPDDVRAFQRSIESFSGTINTTKRLRRVKSHLLDEKDKQEIDLNIQRANEILDDISTTIEACRKDLDQKATVSVRNRIMWLIRDHHTFMARTHTLNVCHQNLNCDIAGMRQLQSPAQLPAYESLDFGGPLRPPSRRHPTSVTKQTESDDHEVKDSFSWKSPSPQPSFDSDNNSQRKASSFSGATPLTKAKSHDETARPGSYIAYSRHFSQSAVEGLEIPRPPIIPRHRWEVPSPPPDACYNDDEQTAVEDFPTTVPSTGPWQYWNDNSTASSTNRGEVRRSTMEGLTVPRRPVAPQKSWESSLTELNAHHNDDDRSSVADYAANSSPMAPWKQLNSSTPSFEMYNHSRNSSLVQGFATSTPPMAPNRSWEYASLGTDIYRGSDKISATEDFPATAPSSARRRGRRSVMIT